MGRERDVCGFGTQAKEYGTDEWTETYKAQLSVDRVTWLPYMENGQEKVKECLLSRRFLCLLSHFVAHYSNSH